MEQKRHRCRQKPAISLLSLIFSILVLERIKKLEERDSHRKVLFFPLHAFFFSVASIITHNFLYIFSMYVKNNLCSVEKDFELKAETKVSPFANTESVYVATCQPTDITYAEVLVAQSQSPCMTLEAWHSRASQQNQHGTVLQESKADISKTISLTDCSVKHNTYLRIFLQ